MEDTKSYADTIKFTKNQVGALLRCWNFKASTDEEDYLDISGKLGQLFGMFFVPEQEEITLKKEK